MPDLGGTVVHVDRSIKDHPVALRIPENICSTCGEPAEVLPHTDDLAAKPRKVKLGPAIERNADGVALHLLQSVGQEFDEDGREDG